MRRIPRGGTVLATLALAGAGGVLAVTVLQAVDPGSVAESPALAGVADPAATDALVPEEVGSPGVAALSAGAGVREAAPPEAVAEGAAPASWNGSAPPAAWDDPLSLAVDNDPFSPRRRPPARRYQLPSEREPVVREEPRERPEAPDFRIVGTAAAGAGLALVRSGRDEPRVMSLGESVEGYTRVREAAPGGTGLALVQVDRDEPRVVSLGESVGGYTLAAVDGESATLVGPAGTLRYPVMEPLMRRDDDDDRRRRRGRDDDDDDDERRRALQEQVERMRSLQRLQQINQGLRGGGLGVTFDGQGRARFFPSRGGGNTPPPVPLRIPRPPTGGGTSPGVPNP